MARETREDFTPVLIRQLKAERLRQDLSQEKLAQKSGISRQAIGKIEAGERMPTMFTVYRLCKALGLSVEEFARRMKI